VPFFTHELIDRASLARTMRLTAQARAFVCTHTFALVGIFQSHSTRRFTYELYLRQDELLSLT
jgi:hypothetical protein